MPIEPFLVLYLPRQTGHWERGQHRRLRTNPEYLHGVLGGPGRVVRRRSEQVGVVFVPESEEPRRPHCPARRSALESVSVGNPSLAHSVSRTRREHR